MSLDDLPAELLDDISMSGAMPSLRDENASLEATERSAIARAVHNAHGNLAQAARALGVSRSTLYRKIEFYRLEGMVKPADRE
ncbi:helix-turn-helix domain-containing protein [Paraburkholderia sp. BR14320]|uniref:helix-turn-helix domain-containing protein n=1 Tax=unclassified Paraburkholderia TaxID=2615204 RepID=UPI0034CF2CDC